MANLAYGICFKVISSCSITYSVLSSDTHSFTVSGDVGAVDPTILSSSTLQEQTCTTDYVIIPNPSQNGMTLNSGSDRFCGLGLAATTSMHLIKNNNLEEKDLLFHSIFSQVLFSRMSYMLSPMQTRIWTLGIADSHFPSHKINVQ